MNIIDRSAIAAKLRAGEHNIPNISNADFESVLMEVIAADYPTAGVKTLIESKQPSPSFPPDAHARVLAAVNAMPDRPKPKVPTPPPAWLSDAKVPDEIFNRVAARLLR